MIVSSNTAMAKPSEHVFISGSGYVRVGELKPLKGQASLFGSAPKGLCDPPAGARNQSWHALQPLQGGKPICFQWLSGPREWFRLETQGKSRRLGFSPAYLSSHGWEYVGPAQGRHG